MYRSLRIHIHPQGPRNRRRLGLPTTMRSTGIVPGTMDDRLLTGKEVTPGKLDR
jgi:hypothetical protein